MKDKTLGFENQVEGLKVARRRSKSPRSQGRHDGCDNSSAEQPSAALVLSDGRDECGPTFEAWALLPNQSMLAAFAGRIGEEPPAELETKNTTIVQQ